MSNRLHLIAEAATPDNAREPGDQTGIELRARFFAPDKRGWVEIYRCTDDDMREKIARFMEEAVSNGQIGYSSNTNASGRNSLFRELEAHENILAKVEPCNCDCSSLVAQAVRLATGIWFDDGKFESPIVSQYLKYKDTPIVSGVRDFSQYLDDSIPYEDGYIRKINGIHPGLFEVITRSYADAFADDSLLQRGDIIRTESLPELFVRTYKALAPKDLPEGQIDPDALAKATALVNDGRDAHIAVYI